MSPIMFTISREHNCYGVRFNC